jgi:hypothetical protein
MASKLNFPPSDIFNCDHIECDEYGFCYGCGELITSSMQCCINDSDGLTFYSKISPSADYSNVNNLTSVPEEVKERALEILKSEGGSIREKTHRQEMYAAVYRASLEFLRKGKVNPLYPLDPEEIAKELGLTKKEINTILLSISRTVKNRKSIGICDNIQADAMIISPLHYIPKICRDNGLMEYYEQINELTKKILNLDVQQKILSQKPKNIATAIVKMFIINERLSVPNFTKSSIVRSNISKIHEIISPRLNEKEHADIIALFRQNSPSLPARNG